MIIEPRELSEETIRTIARAVNKIPPSVGYTNMLLGHISWLNEGLAALKEENDRIKRVELAKKYRREF